MTEIPRRLGGGRWAETSFTGFPSLPIRRKSNGSARALSGEGGAVPDARSVSQSWSRCSGRNDETHNELWEGGVAATSYILPAEHLKYEQGGLLLQRLSPDHDLASHFRDAPVGPNTP